jgi:phosphonate transport system substrate-binding protein
MLFVMPPPNPLPPRTRTGVDRGRRVVVRGLGAGMTTLAGGVVWAGEARPIYSLGVFPFLPALQIGERFAPAALDLGDALDAQIQLRTKDTVADYAAQLAAGTYDIVLVHPFLYLDGHDQQGYRALARADRQVRAVLVGRRHLPARRLTDLRGATIAIVPRTAVAELLRAALLEEGLASGADLRLQPHQTRMACLQAVASGDAVGCVIPSTLSDELPALARLDLVQVWQSGPIGCAVMAVHPRVPAEVAERLRQRMIGWSDTPQGQAILRGLSWPRVLDVADGDFDAVRSIRARLQAGGSG